MVEAELRERITETIYTSKELNEQAYVRAWYAYKQTLRAIEQAWLTYEEAGQSAYKQVEEACERSRQAYRQATQAYQVWQQIAKEE